MRKASSMRGKTERKIVSIKTIKKKNKIKATTTTTKTPQGNKENVKNKSKL